MGPCPPPNLAPNKFQERPSGASRMQENLLATGAPTLGHLASVFGPSALPPPTKIGRMPNALQLVGARLALGNSYGRVFVCLCVTSRYCIETGKRIESMLLLTYPTLCYKEIGVSPK